VTVGYGPITKYLIHHYENTILIIWKKKTAISDLTDGNEIIAIIVS